MGKTLKILKGIGRLVLDTLTLIIALLGMVIAYYYGVQLIAYIVG